VMMPVELQPGKPFRIRFLMWSGTQNGCEVSRSIATGPPKS